MNLKFGTDGVRGVANRDLTPEAAFEIGFAAGTWLQSSNEPQRVVVGRDTRQSGPMLGAALGSGFCSAGISVSTLGVVPTGCVSHAARNGDYGLGVVISASHNPAPDNGIKLMTSAGTKVPAELEQFIQDSIGGQKPERPTNGGVGWLGPATGEVDAYLKWLLQIVPERLEGMTIAIDAANGAASELGIKVFQLLGATVIATQDKPNGSNINLDCGATHPQTIQRLTQEHAADLGIAYDGDADRAVFSDSEGNLVNGDRTMAMWCAHWSKAGRLDPKAVVGTVMSNGGFERHMHEQGITLHRVNVGDKYVSAKLKEISGKIGGEQSGHIVFPDHGPTGDGLVTALEVARVIKLSGRTANDFYREFNNWPQVLVNVELARKEGWDLDPRVAEAISESERALKETGRINVRASGTQPIVRVMVEATHEAARDSCAEAVVQALLEACGGRVYSRVDLTHALGD